VWSGDLFGDPPTSGDRGDSWQRGGGGRRVRRPGVSTVRSKQNVPGIPVASLEDVIALGGALAVVTAV